MTTDTVIVERLIAARPETVFAFFTDRDKWLSWMGTEGEFDFEPGGAFRTRITGENVAEGTFVEIEPITRLVFTWGWAEGGPAVASGSTTVEITLEPVVQGTFLRLVHRDLDTPEARDAHQEGWDHYVDRLALAAGGHDPGPDDWL
ncbi:SRPBCC domain-containing protein [Streptomyces sp. V3I7]|uniref:SRPBCC family protein n=1 Tax=Streptomyces sp. V3I7 TaxID=3042278 RepID=UPI002789F165|nr:SRPBCC domain-containing protein [Streptomyces sp. V3I7]MDQ0994135.1 uncharacterized protein YndB with AHSA1/START domain [Streptomyces sp. V3I7]